jgi:RHS repeat-associated protein
VDHLGSTRLVTDGVTGQVKRRYDYEPFGLSMNTDTSGRSTSVAGYDPADKFNLKFTGHPRDYDSGLQLDFFGARYFGSAMGRFTSTDDPFADQHSDDPQSWNLYSYARNNPLRFIDELGRAVFESAAKLMEAGQEVVGRKELVATVVGSKDGKPIYETYCDRGVKQILNLGGDHTLDGPTMNATGITKFLQNPKNATELLSYDAAVKFAKEGVTVIFAEPGHVNVVAPMDMVKAYAGWKAASGHEDVPMVFNVGAKNATQRLDVSWRASMATQIHAYILNADIKQLFKRRKCDGLEVGSFSQVLGVNVIDLKP